MIKFIKNLFKPGNATTVETTVAVKEPSGVSEPVISLLKAMKEPKRFKVNLSQEVLTELWVKRIVNYVSDHKGSYTLTDTKTQTEFSIYVKGPVPDKSFYSHKVSLLLKSGARALDFHYPGSPFTCEEMSLLCESASELFINQVQRLNKVVAYLELRAEGKRKGQRALTILTARKKLMGVYCSE